MRDMTPSVGGGKMMMMFRQKESFGRIGTECHSDSIANPGIQASRNGNHVDTYVPEAGTANRVVSHSTTFILIEGKFSGLLLV